MDFINGCITNVHVLGSFAATPFTQYSYSASNGDPGQPTNDARRTILELRESKVLCMLVDRDIWLFGHVEHEHEHAHAHALNEKYKVSRAGVVEGQKDAMQLLLGAIESALTHTLAQEDNLTHLAPWTWLCWQRDADDEVDASIITLHVKDTSNGALYLLPEIKPTTWMPIDQAANRANDEVFLAPHGASANFAADDQEVEGVVADDQWKTHVADALRLEGVSLNEDAEWTAVEFVENDVRYSCIWPSRLCLVRQSPQLPEQLSLDDSTGWEGWIDNGQGRVYRDPFAEAEELFVDCVERNRRSAEEATKIEVNEIANASSSSANANDANMTTSPPFMQRTADQQAAVSGIYPTPPDGLAQQGQTQVGAQIGMSAATPSIAPLSDANIGNETFNDPQEQAGDSSGLDAFAMDEGEEDLFGDVGGEMFEENEVGDADFDYFDEPDDVPAVEPPEAEDEDLHMTDGPAVDNQVYADVHTVPDGSEIGNVEISLKPEPGEESASSPTSAAVPTESATDSRSGYQAPEKRKGALSPFGIRERLLPPPVPASASHASDDAKHFRRSSSFAPITFRNGVDLGAKYAGMDITPALEEMTSTSLPSIALPSSRNKDSDEGSDEFGSSDGEVNDVQMPPRLPWERTKKRKRSRDVTDNSSPGMGEMWPEGTDDVFESAVDSEQERFLRKTMLDRIISPTSRTGIEYLTGHLVSHHQQQAEERQEEQEEEDALSSLAEFYELDSEDLISIAQLISEQASTCLLTHTTSNLQASPTDSLCPLLMNALAGLIPSPLEPCDLLHMALIRDSAPPPRANARVPVPLRPGPEVPDVFVLPAPHIRVQRNNENWEMLPSALCFWEPNGLAAVSGPKNVRARAVLPSNNDLREATRALMSAVGRTYEGCKLGTHSYGVSDDGEKDAGALVEEDGLTGSKAALLQGYVNTCVKVGEELAAWCAASDMGWEGTFVVYILDPFTGAGWKAGKNYLCACFWKLFQAYREQLNASKKIRSGNIVPDVVLQILPMELVAGMDRLVIPDSAILASLAREVYDRCPASLAVEDEGAGAAAPSVLLAPPVPKRIAFQLHADVPAESLMQDGRVLHLAVAMSGDREWMHCVWSTGQGCILAQESFCMRGVTVGSVVMDVWKRTGELVDRVRVGWRVFMVLDEGIWHGTGLDRVWRDVVTVGKASGTTVCVTLVKVCTEMIVTVHGEVTTWDGAVGLATPASTPAAFPGNGATTGTNSPNIGTSDGFGAPLTPAASETMVSGTAAAMSVVENDPDAHLIEVEDESCGLLLKPHLSALAGMDGMANGAIVRKGKGSGGERGVLGVSICWTVQVKPQGTVDTGSARQAEVTLREVLKMYRALSVLTRARGLHEGEKELLPVHLAVACKGARALEGMLFEAADDER